ncbi:MAG TPA: ankyrin repeat domain-containing protein [Candidatus Aquirickettsiella sp.]
MEKIISFMKILDFPVKGWKGICQGCAIMAAQAFTLGPKEYNRYQERLKRIELIIDEYPNLTDSLKSETFSKRLDHLGKILKTLPSNNFLDEGEDELISIRAFLEGIAISQNPGQFQEEYSIFQPHKSNINQVDTNLIIKLAQSKLSEARGGLCQVTSFSGVYNAKEMETFLDSWENYLQKQKEEKPYYALLLYNRFHTFMLGYDVDNKVWVLNNNSEVIKYESTPTENFSKKPNPITVSQPTNDIFNLLSFINNSEKEWVSYPQERFIVNITIYSIKEQLILAESILKDTNWEKIHSVIPEKAKFQGKIHDTWLYVAAERGHLDTVKQLILLTDDINQPIDSGETPIFIAAQNGHTEVVEELIKAGANIHKLSYGVTPLFIAAQNGHINIVKLLLNVYVKINAKFRIDEIICEICTPLFVAAQNGHTEVIEELIKAGANIDKPSNNGDTPLFVAAQNGHAKVVEVLVKAGVKFDNSSSISTSLFMAAQNGHTDVVKILLDLYVKLDASPKIDETIYEVCTPLFVAAQNGHIEIVKLLVKAGANINKTAFNGATPLSIALQNGHPDIIKLFNKLGAVSAATCKLNKKNQPTLFFQAKKKLPSKSVNLQDNENLNPDKEYPMLN